MKRFLLCVLLLAAALPARGQTHVDDDGVWRWTGSGNEVTLFGVNYSTPFAYGYRAVARMGTDHKAAIDRDVLHLRRLGLDAFRIHVWDREVSTARGDLVENHHLDLLDYLIHRLSSAGIKTILTPIAWWPPGYPEPAPDTDGISDGFSKGAMTTDPEALPRQLNYVQQFIRHRNPYSGLTYLEDPDVLAVEIFNEPDHPGSPDETTAFINALAGALREAGLQKPIFYNISQGYWDDHGHAVCASDIDGVSVQWYPTGLVRNGAVGGNMLPNVDSYPLPFADFPECRDKARMVYEFDAADVAGSALYPAMARSFRGAGFQWATQFAYDPLAIAHSNTEYQTHFLNLVHTPARAIGFLIAGEAFRRLPRGFRAGTYPESASFAGFQVRYEPDLALFSGDSLLLHSASTDVRPAEPEALRRIAGVGSSPLVSYRGSGSYFLDRVARGVWRLEVYPDAVWVDDPFTRGSLERHAVRIRWEEHPMTVRLPDLAAGFSVTPLNAGNTHRPAVVDGRFGARPGVYLLHTSDAVDAAAVDARYFAPPPDGLGQAVAHDAPPAVTAGDAFPVRIRTAEAVDSAAVFVRRVSGPARFRLLPAAMDEQGALAAEIPGQDPGLIEYGLVTWSGGHARTWPGGWAGTPRDWDFTGREFWQVPVVEEGLPQVLFDAARDRERLLVPHPWQYVPFSMEISGGSMPDRLALRGEVRSFEPDPHHLSIRSFLPRQAFVGPGADAVLVVRARATGRPVELEVALVETDAQAWGHSVHLEAEWQDLRVPLADLRKVPLTLLPRPYPQFLPYRFESASLDAAVDLAQLDGLQFSIQSPGDPAGFEVERVTLMPRRE